MLDKFKQDEEVADKLPVDEEIFKLPRDWMIGVIHTVKGTEFTDWVAGLVE